ncbi:MAG: hypothetical protein ACKPA9_04460 [Microcystis sp.]
MGQIDRLDNSEKNDPFLDSSATFLGYFSTYSTYFFKKTDAFAFTIGKLPFKRKKSSTKWFFGLCYAIAGGYKGWNPYRERHWVIFVNCF